MVKQVVRICWTAAVIFGVFWLSFAISQKEVIDQTIVANPDNSYRVASDAILSSDMWFAIKSGEDLIPCQQSDGGYQIQTNADQRWKLANYNTSVSVSASAVGYVHAIEYAQTADVVLLFSLIAMFGLLVWAMGFVITT